VDYLTVFFAHAQPALSIQRADVLRTHVRVFLEAASRCAGIRGATFFDSGWWLIRCTVGD